jgi:hypothetical protein
MSPPTTGRIIRARYLLSTHTVGGERREPMTDEQMRETYERLAAIEQEMNASGAWVFSARLHEPETATVARVAGGDVLTTDCPFVESREHLAGFYIIEAEDLDAALSSRYLWKASPPPAGTPDGVRTSTTRAAPLSRWVERTEDDRLSGLLLSNDCPLRPVAPE